MGQQQMNRAANDQLPEVCVSSRWRKYVCHKLHCPSSVVPAGCLCLLSINWNDSPSNCFFWHMLCVRFFQSHFSHVTPYCIGRQNATYLLLDIYVSLAGCMACVRKVTTRTVVTTTHCSRSHFFSFLVKCNFPYFTCELWPFPWQAMLLSYSVEGELLQN